MLVAFDFGISNTDIAVFKNNKTTFHSIPSKHKIISPELIREVLPLPHSPCIPTVSGVPVLVTKSTSDLECILMSRLSVAPGLTGSSTIPMDDVIFSLLVFEEFSFTVRYIKL
mgnify:CR=1 FL=1